MNLRVASFLALLFACAAAPAAKVAGWYQVEELRPGLYKIREDEHCSFFAIKTGDRAVLVDSGMGFSKALGESLMKALGIRGFDVVVTHAHLDHVGLNFLAGRVGISRREWDKFRRLNEQDQMRTYHRHFAKTLPWPAGVERPRQQPWKPTDFLDDGSVFTAGDIRLEAIALPGHTEGSLGYYERAKGWLFSGDLVYLSREWPHYLDFADSSFAAYVKSVARLDALVAGPRPPLLLPAHGKIPLDPAFVGRVRRTVDNIAAGRLAPKGPAPIPAALSKLLLPALEFEADEAAFLIQRSDLPKR